MQIKNKKILILTKNLELRTLVFDILNNERFENVQRIQSDEEIYEALQRSSLDLLIVDLAASEKVSQVIQTVREVDILESVMVLVISGDASKEEIIKSVEWGANECLLLPFKKEQLINKVVTLFSLSQQKLEKNKMIADIQEHLRKDDLENASKLITNVEATDGKKATTLYFKSLIELKKSNHDSAIALLEDAKKLNPHFLPALRLLADLCEESKRWDEANRHFEDELKINPKQPVRWLKWAKCQYNQQKYKEATESLRQALMYDFRMLESLLLMAKTWEKLGSFEKSFYYLKRVWRYFPNHIGSLRELIRLASTPEHCSLLNNFFSEQTKKIRNNEEIFAVYAEFLDNKMDDKVHAKQVCEAGLKFLPQSEILLKTLLRILVDDGQIKEARGLLNGIDPSHPSLRTLSFYFSEHLANLGLFEEAIEILHQSTKNCSADKDVSESLMRLGLSLVKSSQYSRLSFVIKRLRNQPVDSYLPKFLLSFEKVESQYRQRRQEALASRSLVKKTA